MKKKLIAMILFTTMLFWVTACAKQGTSQEAAISQASQNTETKDVSDLRLACTLMSLDNPYFIAVMNGFNDRCKELGIECQVTDGKYDASVQISIMENFIASGYDGICLSAVDGEGIASIVQQAQQKGIVVIGQAQAVTVADGNFIVHEYDYGAMVGAAAAKWINEKLDGEAEVLLITEDNVDKIKLRGDGIEDKIMEMSPNAKIVSRQAGVEPESAMKIAESALAANPNIKVIACTNDSAALGAYEAVKNIVKDTSDFCIVGADATAEALAMMQKEGNFFRCTIDIDPYGTGKRCVDMLVDYIQNGVKNETVYFEMIPVYQEGWK